MDCAARALHMALQHTCSHEAALCPGAAGKEKLSLLTMLGITSPEQQEQQQAEQGHPGRARPRSALRPAAAVDGHQRQPPGSKVLSRDPSRSVAFQPHMLSRPGTPLDGDSDASHASVPLLGSPAELQLEGGEATCEVLAVVGTKQQVG